MSDLMDQGINIAHPSCPTHQDIRMDAIRVSCITTGILAFIGRKVDPTFGLVAGNFARIFFPKRCHRFHDQVISVINGDIRVERAVQIQLPISKGHFLKAIDLGHVFEEFLSDRSEVLHDQVNLAIKHGTIYFLLSQEVVKDRVVAPHICNQLFRLDLS